MRYLGIDYGSKRIGLALSDEGGSVAFPHSILSNTSEAVTQIAAICAEKQVTQIILGESLNLNQQANPVMTEITAFKNKLTGVTKLKIVLEPEWFTSALAARSLSGEINNPKEKRDDSAAALILQTYLDRQKNRL